MNSSIKQEWFTAFELEGMGDLPNKATNITRRATKENWEKRQVQGKKGIAYEYHYSSLPLDVQRQLGFEQGQEVQKAPVSETLNENVLMIDSFSSINVSAGFGSFNEGVTKPDEQTPYSASLLRKLGVNPKYAAVFWADGISMRPTIDDGDQMLVDLKRKEIKGDKIYLVQNGASVWVKRVKIRWDGVELISDNREEYPPIILSKDEAENLQVIGQLVHLGKNMI
ncbi:MULTISPECIES: helix-turn-helix domain-containing protein [Pasteurellaceae]|uniref:Helix-turn-helix transcriptional regulator n=1 Tax=Haemophilus haemolyticus TaxID=726 RepID=A0A852Q2N7_HAEHA|nr:MULTISPECIES: helix-turn-helix transcriptional regulator [Pasteurellaceae]NYA27609.1 helix-turn-helix transcriptional regulator [Haemophilus haemolyticus]